MDQNATQNAVGSNSDNNQNENNMASLLENEGLGIDFPTQGEIRKGVIASITTGRILVSVGTKSEGIIEGKEYELIPSDELANLQLGQEIPVFVINPEDQNGNLILSYMRAREEEGWTEVESLLASKQATHSSIIGYNKGGLIVPVGGLRGFVPASQISMTRRSSATGRQLAAPASAHSGAENDSDMPPSTTRMGMNRWPRSAITRPKRGNSLRGTPASR